MAFERTKEVINEVLTMAGRVVPQSQQVHLLMPRHVPRAHYEQGAVIRGRIVSLQIAIRVWRSGTLQLRGGGDMLIAAYLSCRSVAWGLGAASMPPGWS